MSQFRKCTAVIRSTPCAFGHNYVQGVNIHSQPLAGGKKGMSACKQMRPEFCSDASITECSSDLGAGPRVVRERFL